MIDVNNIGDVITECTKTLKKNCKNNLIYKIEIRTYQRELERYRNRYIEISEKTFFIDSECIISLLFFLKNRDENLRWKTAFMLIDRFLCDKGFILEEKYKYLAQMSDSFRLEFGYNMYHSKQLNDRYREHRREIEIILSENKENVDLLKIDSILKKKSRKIQIFIRDKDLILYENLFSYIQCL